PVGQVLCPLNPCGMIIDPIRSAYYAWIKVDPQGTVRQRIRWYFAEPDAKVFPYPTVFGSSNWLDVKYDYDGPGEEVEGHHWANGASPGRYTGQKFWGKPESGLS